jgi:hypothetical protein
VVGLLGCVTVQRGERRAGRFTVPRHAAHRLVELLQELGLFAELAPFDYVPGNATGPARAHEGGFVPRGSAPGALNVLHLARDDVDCSAVRVAELDEDHETVGALFGYPPCCVRAFVAARQEQRGREDLTVATVPDVGPFPRLLNPLLRHLYGFRLVFHFPCSPRCEPSLELACRRSRFLLEESEAARELTAAGSGLAIYGSRIGAALVGDFDQVAPGRYVARAARLRPVEGSPFRDGASSPEIHVRSVRSFSVGGVEFDDQAHFAAFFA